MSELSGGERARIALLELSLRKPNFLILDEPTNHLDIDSREALEKALDGYDGTILCVSHDRYLINRLAMSLLVLRDGELSRFDGGYSDYINTLQPEAAAVKKEKAPNEYQLRKQRESAERKRQTRIRKIEEAVAALDDERRKINAMLEDGSVTSDYMKVTELTERLAAIDAEEESLLAQWDDAENV